MPSDVFCKVIFFFYTMEKEKSLRQIISFSLQRILCLLVYSYSIQTFLKQNVLMREISIKTGVKGNVRFIK